MLQRCLCGRQSPGLRAPPCAAAPAGMAPVRGCVVFVSRSRECERACADRLARRFSASGGSDSRDGRPRDTRAPWVCGSRLSRSSPPGSAIMSTLLPSLHFSHSIDGFPSTFPLPSRLRCASVDWPMSRVLTATHACVGRSILHMGLDFRSSTSTIRCDFRFGVWSGRFRSHLELRLRLSDGHGG